MTTKDILARIKDNIDSALENAKTLENMDDYDAVSYDYQQRLVATITAVQNML